MIAIFLIKLARNIIIIRQVKKTNFKYVSYTFLCLKLSFNLFFFCLNLTHIFNTRQWQYLFISWQTLLQLKQRNQWYSMIYFRMNMICWTVIHFHMNQIPDDRQCIRKLDWNTNNCLREDKRFEQVWLK